MGEGNKEKLDAGCDYSGSDHLFGFDAAKKCVSGDSQALLAKLCEENFKENFSDARQCTDFLGAVSLPDYFSALTRGFYDPTHPEAVIGACITQAEIEAFRQYKIKKYPSRSNLQIGLKELQKFYKMNVGKVAIWQVDQLGVMKLKAISEFLSDDITGACGKVGLMEDECMLYHIVSYENSGDLWAAAGDNPSVSAVGPGQIMPEWFDRERKLSDSLDTQNFFKDALTYQKVVFGGKGKKKKITLEHVTFDGRYDPIANVEMGARIMHDCINFFGPNHPDFVVLAYNQGTTTAGKALRTWARKPVDKGGAGVEYDEFFKEWEKARYNLRASGVKKRYLNAGYKEFFGKVEASERPYASFLDYLYQVRGGKPMTVAEIVADQDICDVYFRSHNGGKEYISKILAVYEIFKDPSRFGIKMKGTNASFPAVLKADGRTVEYKWDDLFMADFMKNTESSAAYAGRKKIDLSVLMFINRQIKDTYVAFNKPVRIWLPKPGVPEAYMKRFRSEGTKILADALADRSKYLAAIGQPAKKPSKGKGAKGKGAKKGKKTSN